MRPSIAMFESHVAPSARRAVGELFHGGRLSEGPKVREFERALEIALGLRFGVAVHSGTAALHLALLVAGVGPGDEVICPAQTFIATALAIRYTGATPVFADIQYDTGNICPASVRDKLTDKTRAVLAVHWGGMPADLDELHALAAPLGIPVVEDAAQALGAMYRKRAVGSISPFTCFSFQAIKHLTTGDGGLVTCLDKVHHAELRRRRWFGIDRREEPGILGERESNIHELGFKYHMNDLAATLGLANMQGLGKRMERIQEIARTYDRHLGMVAGLELFQRPADRVSSFWLYGMHVERREGLVRKLFEAGISASVVHQRIDRHSLFASSFRGELERQKLFDETQLHIPIYAGLTDADVDHIVRTIQSGW